MNSEEGPNFDEDNANTQELENKMLEDDERSLAQVRAYLRLRGTVETARLAAALAPKADTFDPAALIDQALILQTEVEAGLLRRRKSMVERMDYSTLAILLNELGVVGLGEMIVKNDERLLDPIIGPALNAFRHYGQQDYLKLAAEWKVADALNAADSRTTLPRPGLPCKLEEALRYAANAPDASWTALEKAHAEYQQLSIPFNDNGEGMAYLRSLPLRTQLKLLKSAKTTELSPFVPVGPPPEIPDAILPEFADLIPVDDKTEMVFSEMSLADLASGFHSHWQQHGTSYENQENLFKEKGSTGPSIRDRELWIQRTQDFIASDTFNEYLSSEQRLQSRISFETAVAIFLQSCNVAKTKAPPAKAKAEKFLLTLFAYRDQKMTSANLKKFKGTLNNSGISAISEDIIVRCHGLLKARLDEGLRFKPKKSKN